MCKSTQIKFHFLRPREKSVVSYVQYKEKKQTQKCGKNIIHQEEEVADTQALPCGKTVER